MKTKTLYWILGAWLTLLLVMALAGCRTKSVTEYVVTHDTLRVTSTDTVRLVKVERVADTLRVETERVVTLSTSGDTVKVVEVRDRWRDRWNVRTDTVYQAKTDTIYKVTESARDKQTARQPSWWQRWGVFLAVMVVCVIAVIAIRK